MNKSEEMNPKDDGVYVIQEIEISDEILNPLMKILLKIMT